MHARALPLLIPPPHPPLALPPPPPAVLAQELEDLALDVPSAPALLGRLVGSSAASGLVSLDYLTDAAGACESAAPRRGFVAAALKAVQVRVCCVVCVCGVHVAAGL